MKKYIILIIFIYCCHNVSAQQATVTLPDANSVELAVPQRIGNSLMIPFGTVFPVKGDRSITGIKMQGALGSYLRGYHHYLYQPAGKRPFVFKQEMNIETSGADALNQSLALLKKTPLILGFMGTELFLSLEPYIASRACTLLFPIEGLEELRNPKHTNVIYFRPSHTQEIKALLDYAINKQHKTSIALLYEESFWGSKLLAKTQTLLKQFPEVHIVAQASYPQGTVEIEKALETIADKAPNVVLCLARSRPAYTFVHQALNKKLHETLFLGLSELCAIQSILQSTLGMNIVVTSVVPDPEQHKSLPIIQEYLKTMSIFLSARADSPLYLENFITMSIIEDAAQKIIAAEKPLTSENIIKHLSSYKNTNFHGIKLSFNEQDRSLSPMLWINPGHGQPWICYRGCM